MIPAWVAAILLALGAAPIRLDHGRFTAVCYRPDSALAVSLLAEASRTDTFPGLPRPHERVLIAIAPDRARFREWVGPNAPEWGVAVAFPLEHRVVIQGRSAPSSAGDPRETLRHELAHVALADAVGSNIPTWFDEGYASYAAREWRRSDILSANLSIALHGAPTFAQLDRNLRGTAGQSEDAYAFAYLAVADLATISPNRGLALLFTNWGHTGKLDPAMRLSFGMTLDGFEEQWRAQMKARYGGVAFVEGLAIGGLLIAGMVMPFQFARRRRDQRLRLALAAAEEATTRLKGGAGAMTIPELEIRRVEATDFAMIYEWRSRPHIVATWGPCPTVDELRGKLFGRDATPYIAWRYGEPIAFLQSYVAADTGDGWWPDVVDRGVVGIDLFLADAERQGKGLGPGIVNAFVEWLFQDPAVTEVQADPSPMNGRAVRCFEKAGFISRGEVDTPDGRAILMVRRRMNAGERS